MKDYKTLCRGLRTLFWLELGSVIGSLVLALSLAVAVIVKTMDSDGFLLLDQSGAVLPMESVPLLIALAWALVLMLAMAVARFRLGRVESRYIAAGVLLLLQGILAVTYTFIEKGFLQMTQEYTLLLSLPMTGLSIASTCVEIGAHRHALAGVDDKLAKKWRVLRIMLLCAVPAIALIFLLIMGAAMSGNPVLIFAVMPLILLIPGGLIALHVLRYVYLYKTGTRFLQRSLSAAQGA